MKKKLKKIKITQPEDGAKKTYYRGFRADKELAKLLDELPNKSEFMERILRNAFVRRKTVTCTRCNGAGKILKRLKGKRIVR